jgi:hypothetical protein
MTRHIRQVHGAFQKKNFDHEQHNTNSAAIEKVNTGTQNM